MTSITRRLLVAVIAAVPVAAFTPSAQAQAYPAKAIRVVVPFAAGSATDTVARIYTQKMGELLAASMIVDNRAGANGSIGADLVAKAPADGYTVLVGTNTTNAAINSLMKKVPFDFEKDFAPVSFLGSIPLLVCVNNDFPAKTLKELIAMAKSRPGTITFATASASQRVSSEMLASMTGMKLVHVPYKSSSDIIADMLAGRIEAVFAPTAFLLAQVREGKLLGLGISSPQGIRSPIEVPSVSEAAIPGYEYATWYGFIASSKAPVQVLEPLSRAIREISEEKDVKDKYAAQGINPRVITLREFDAYIKADMDKLAPIIKAVGAKAN